MTCSIERAVVEARPFCLVAEQEEEIEFHIAPNESSEGPCRIYILHADNPPEELLLPNEEQTLRWRSPGLRAGILTVLTVAEREGSGGWASTATPIPVLPWEAAQEMRDIFEKTIHQEMKSTLLLSSDCQLNDAQQTAMRQVIWRNHIQSFAVDLDFLLNDLDDGSGSDEVAPEKMCVMLLKVFRNVFEFLKKQNAHNTIQYLIQACKERGVISFYSKYQREEEERDDFIKSAAAAPLLTLYERATRCWNNSPGSDEEDDGNNNHDDNIGDDTEASSEFSENFGMSNCGVGFVGGGVSAKSSLMNEDVASVADLNAFQSFDEFSRDGAFRSHLCSEDGVIQDRPSEVTSYLDVPCLASPREQQHQGIQEGHRRSPRSPSISHDDVREAPPLPPQSASMSNMAVHVAGSSMSLNAFVFPFVIVVLCLVAARALESFKASYLITVLTFSLLTIPVYREFRRLLNPEFKLLSHLVVSSTLLIATYSLFVSCIAQGLDRNK